MARYVIVDNAVVVNVVLWDGESPCDASIKTAIIVNDDAPVGPGYSYVNGQFIAPTSPPSTRILL